MMASVVVDHSQYGVWRNGLRAFLRLLLTQQLRQLGEVNRQPPRLVLGQQIGGRAPAGLMIEIDVSQGLPWASFMMKQAPPLSSNVQGGGNWRGDGTAETSTISRRPIPSFSPALAQMKRAPTGDSPAEAQVRRCSVLGAPGGATHNTRQLGMLMCRQATVALSEMNSQLPIGSPDHLTGPGWSTWHSE